ncbi:MAG: hypothetical protein P8Y58_12535 [Novosphingobium sp.]
MQYLGHCQLEIKTRKNHCNRAELEAVMQGWQSPELGGCIAKDAEEFLHHIDNPMFLFEGHVADMC